MKIYLFVATMWPKYEHAKDFKKRRNEFLHAVRALKQTSEELKKTVLIIILGMNIAKLQVAVAGLLGGARCRKWRCSAIVA